VKAVGALGRVSRNSGNLNVQVYKGIALPFYFYWLRHAFRYGG